LLLGCLAILDFAHTVATADWLAGCRFEWDGCVDSAEGALAFVLDAILTSATSSTASFSSDCCAHAHRRRWRIVGESAAMIGHWG
jgi:hypothetical protein